MGVKKNFSYNLILTGCNYIFPLLVFPYVSRVLGVEQIGICNFVDGIINYFILFSMLGIGSFGIREIARCGDDLQQRSIVFSNLVMTNFMLTAVSITLLVVCTFIIPKLLPYKEFLFVGILKIVFNMFLIEWFFQGIEKFKYITIRSVAVRTLYVIAIFLFVKTKEDSLLYFFLTSMMVVVNAISNWIYSRNFRDFSLKHLNLKMFIVPILVFGYYRLLTSMYTTFNTIFLGFSSGDVEVGYFTTATKLYTIIMAVFSAFTAVMIPRVSAMLRNKEYDGIQSIADQTFEILFLVSLPVISLCMFYAPEIINIIAGSGYSGAILPFKIVIFLLAVIGMEQIVIQQFLMASNSNKSIMIVSTVGAVSGILLNFLITPRLGAVGSAISWCVSEVLVLTAGIILLKKYLNIKINWQKIFKIVITSALYWIVNAVFRYTLRPNLALLLSVLLTTILFYVITVHVIKNKQVRDILSKLAGRFTK